MLPYGMLRYRYRYPPGRPGYPAEGWVVFLNANWYGLLSKKRAENVGKERGVLPDPE